MTRDEAFYAFGAAIGDQKCGLHFPELLRFGSLPKANAPISEQLEFCGRVAEVVGNGWTLHEINNVWHFPEPRPSEWRVRMWNWESVAQVVTGAASDLSWAALLAALAALESR